MQDYAIYKKNCRDQKCAKAFSIVGNRTRRKKKFGHAPIITTKTERLLCDKTAKLCKCPNKGFSSTSGCKRSIQRRLKERFHYIKRAEAVARNKTCNYCGMTIVKKFNRDKYVQNAQKGDIDDSILSIYDKSSALDSENIDKDILEVLFVSNDGTI